MSRRRDEPRSRALVRVGDTLGHAVTSPGPTRVVRVVTRLNIGGPSIHAIELSSRLTPLGFETLLVHGRLGEGEGDMGYLVDEATPRPETLMLPSLRRAIAPWSDTCAAGEMYRLLCRVRPAIVHTHMAKAGAVGRMAAALYNRTAGRHAPARVLHTYHGHVLEGYFSPAKARLFVGVERRLASATDCLIAIAPRLRDELIAQYRIGRADQYRVIPLGFDLDRFLRIDSGRRTLAREALQIPAAAAVVSTVGRLTAVKDQRLFLEAVRLVVDSHESAVFLIAGDGELRPELERAVETLGLARHVRFLGWRRDLETIYGATDVFALTSRNEGTPVALIESMAAGCAGVSTDVGAVRDVVPDSSVGVIVERHDAAAIAAAIGSLLADAGHRRALGERGREHVRARYGISRLVSDVANLYRELIDTNSDRT